MSAVLCPSRLRMMIQIRFDCEGHVIMFPKKRATTVVIIVRCAALGVFLLLEPTATAGEHAEGGSPSGLAGLVDKALARSPNLQVLEARLNEAHALQRQAESFWAGDLAIGLRHNNDGFMDQEGLQEWEWGIELPLWLPGQKRARERVAEQAGQAAENASVALKLIVAGLVREAVWEMALGENQAQIAEREWNTAARLEQDVTKRVRYGELARTDLILASQETLLKQASHRRSVSDYQNALHRFQVLTGASAMPARYSEEPKSLRAITDGHPLLAEAQAGVARAMAEREQAQRERWASPTLTLGTRHERAEDGEDYADSLTAILRVPLGLASQTTPAIARAELALAEAESGRDRLRRRLQLALDRTLREVDTTRAELALAEMQDKLAKENLKLTQRAFALGEADLVSLIRVQSQAFAAQRSFRQMRFELGRAVARLNQALGNLP